jgi:hypothetical protein
MGSRMRICIYTCITGGYETLNGETNKIKGVDLICFTESTTLASDIWQIEHIELFDRSDPSRSQRYIKCCPHLHPLLNLYDITVYIDNTVKIGGQIEPLLNNFIASDADIGLFEHTYRSSLYEELEAIRQRKINSDETTAKIIAMASSIDSKLLIERPFWGGFIIRNMKSSSTKAFGASWFSMVLLGSKRDQLSLPIALSLSNAKVYPLQSTASDIFKSSFHSWPSHVNRKSIAPASHPSIITDDLIKPYAESINQKILAEKLAMEEEYIRFKTASNRSSNAIFSLKRLAVKIKKLING